MAVCRSTHRAGSTQYESPGVGHAHVPPEQTVPSLSEQSLASRHSTHCPLGTSQIGLGVTQSVFDTQPLGLPLLLELDEDVPPPSPPLPPDPLLLLLLDELDPVVGRLSKSRMSWHPPASSMIAAETPTSPPTPILTILCMLTASKRACVTPTISGPDDNRTAVVRRGRPSAFGPQPKTSQPFMAFRKPFTSRSTSRCGTEQRPTRRAPCTGTTKMPSSLSRAATRSASAQSTVVKNPPSYRG
jgi:hypothetical protein